MSYTSLKVRMYRGYRFRTASFDDLRNSFEASSGRSLADFFHQWVTRPGAPERETCSAEAGDPVGMYNYGLDLIRGHGVAKDEARGRQYVDQAALGGLDIARHLQDMGYDLDEVTPDADDQRYAPENE